MREHEPLAASLSPANQQTPAKAGLLMPMMTMMAARVISVAAEVEMIARIGRMPLARARVTITY